MNPKLTYAIIVLLVAIIGIQAYHQYTQRIRIERLERAAKLNNESETTDSVPLGRSSLPTSPHTFDWDSDPLDSLFDDSLGLGPDPFSSMQRLQEQMDQLWGNSFSSPNPFGLQGPMGGFRPFDAPRIEITDQGNHYLVKISPIDPNTQDVEARVENQILTLTFKTKSSTEEKKDSEQGSIAR